MAKKSKKIAARQAASTKRKKGKASLSQRQLELSGVTAPAPTPAAAEAPASDPTSPASSSPVESADSTQQAAGSQPTVAIPAAVGAPWRYAYVLTDIKRIGLLASVVAALLVVLTFVLR